MVIPVDHGSYQLSQTHLHVIQSAAEGYKYRTYYERLKITNEFKSGRSGARVFEAQWLDKSGDGTPTILKLDKMNKLKREIDFSANLKERPSFLPVVAHSPLSEDFGCIIYSHGSAQQPGELATLEGLCKECLSKGTGSLDELLALIGVALGCLDRQLRRGGASYKGAYASKVLDYYLGIWFPTMDLRVQDVEYNQEKLEFLFDHEGSFVELMTGVFEWDSEWRGRRIKFPLPGTGLYLADKIWVNIEGTASFRISDLAAGRLRKVLANRQPKQISVAGEIQDTRLMFYGRVFRGLGFDPETQTLAVAGLDFVNPMLQLNRRLDDWKALEPKMQFAPGHGDFHAGNVLFVRENPYFIDHAYASESMPVWADAARLIGCLWCDVMMPELSAEEQAQVLDAAFRNKDKHLNEKSERIAKFLRGLVQQALSSVHKKLPSDERDLWINLHHFAWVTVKWEDEQPKHPGRVLLAALAGEMADAAMGRPVHSDTSIKMPKSRPEPISEGGSEDPFSCRIRGEIAEVLSKPGLRPFLKPLFQRLGGAGTPNDLPEALSHLVMQKSVPGVQGCLVRVFNAFDLPETRLAWRDGENIVGWRILADVNAGSCLGMKDGVKYMVSQESLLGVEIVLSWHDYRAVAVQQRGDMLVGTTCLPDLPEQGPQDSSFVEAVAKALYVLMNLQTKEGDLCSLVNGALEVARGMGTPYYLVADLSDENHPLHIPSVFDALQEQLGNLTVVYLNKKSATETSLLIQGEAHLAGAINKYLEEKSKWFDAHP